MDKLQADNCVPILENENWGVLFYVSVRTGASGARAIFSVVFRLGAQIYYSVRSTPPPGADCIGTNRWKTNENLVFLISHVAANSLYLRVAFISCVTLQFAARSLSL